MNARVKPTDNCKTEVSRAVTGRLQPIEFTGSMWIDGDVKPDSAIPPYAIIADSRQFLSDVKSTLGAAFLSLPE
jgi:hypothetical protein